MDELTSMLQRASIGKDLEAVAHDVSIIMLCYQLTEETGIIHMLPYNHCLLKRKTYASSQVLYADILHVLQDKGLTTIMLEIMPYIDDYIKYFTD